MNASTPSGSGSAFLGGTDGLSRLSALTGRVLAELDRHMVADRPWTGFDPQVLAAELAELDLLPDQGIAPDQVIDEVGRLVLANGVGVTHPWTAAHLHCPPLVDAVAMEVAIGATNQSMDSFDQAPAATLVEDLLVRRLGGLLGLPPTRSGVMTAGGTASNLLGLTMAREHAARRVGVDLASVGIAEPAVAAVVSRWRVVTSVAAHFSVVRAAVLLGLGRRAVLAVPVGDDGAMDAEALDREVGGATDRGETVIAIVGTAGTTDHGAIDPLEDLAQHAAACGAWLHVDAAVGAALATSDTHRSRLAGIERADSVTVDFHKLWWQPLGASALLVARADDHGLVRDHSDYLDRDEDVADGVLNLVGRSLDTSRRFDALKVAASLRTTGRLALGGMVDALINLASAIGAHIDARPDLELVAPPSTVTVLFRWIGDPTHADADLDVDAVNIGVQRNLFDTGRAVIGRTRIDGRVVLKLTLMNPTTSVDDLRGLIDEVASTARVISDGGIAGAAITGGEITGRSIADGTDREAPHE